MAESNVTPAELNELSIYEGGNLNEIRAEDLTGNVIAVKQLINSYNLKVTENRNKDVAISRLQSDLEYQKTSPFISIVAMIVNLLGSTVVAISVNLLTNATPPKCATVLLIIGIGLVFCGSLSAILYPYAKDFFNKEN